MSQYHTDSSQPTFVQRLFLGSWRPFAWVSIVVLLVYGRTLTFTEWTYLDDYHLIVEAQPLLTDPGHLLTAFVEDVFHKHQGGMYYRPLLTLSFMLDTFFGGTNPAVYHFSNIAYHLLVCLLLIALFKALRLGNAFALCAALVFAIHPATAQTVAWIPGRNESLLAIFVLLACLAFIRFDASRKVSWLGAYIACFALALATKENGLMLVPLTTLFVGARVLQGERYLLGHYILLALGWVFIVLYWHYARQAAMILGISDYSHAMRSVVSHSIALFTFFQTIVWPWNLPTVAVTEDLSILPGLIGMIGSVVIVLLAKEKRWPLFLFGLSWFIIFLLPTFYRHPAASGQTRFFEHRIYLSFIGVLLMAASVSISVNWKRLQSLRIPAFLVLCLVLGGLTWFHSASFADAMAFSEQTARSSPRSTFVHLELSMMQLPASLRSSVDFTKLTVSPVEYYSRLNKLEEQTRTSLEQQPTDTDLQLALAALQFAKGRLKNSEEVLQRMLSSNPENITVYYNLGVLYYNGHSARQAEEYWLKTLERNPSDAETHRNLCYLYYEWKNVEKARLHAEQAAQFGAAIPPELLAELKSPVN